MAMQSYTQTGRLFRFSLKKEWLKLTLWLIGCLSFVAIGVFAFIEVYGGDQAEREALAMAMSNPAMEALIGRVIGVDNYTIGAMYSNTMTIMTLCLFAVMSILLVVRNTRAEEEDGILEMLRALPTGRLTHSTSAVLLLVLTNLIGIALVSLMIILAGEETMGLEGAMLTGVIYGTVGLLFGAITLLTAQLSSNARGAMMGAFSILGLSYILRIIGDSGQEIFSWISPLGLLYGTEPFVDNNWWPVFVVLGASFIILLFALFLGQHRDIDAGLLPDRSGKRHASSFLKTTMGFALRMLKTPLIAWAVAVFLLGVSYGSVIGDVESMIEGNEIIEQILVNDSTFSLVDQFISMIIGVLAIAAAIPAVQVLLRLKSEEKTKRTEILLTGERSRISILFIFVILSFLTSIVMQAVQMGSFAGAAVAMDFDIDFVETFVTGIAYLPAMWVIIGVGVLLYGWIPKLSSLVWGVLGFSFIVHYFAELFDMPEWLMSVSPYYHVPQMPMEEWNWPVFLILTAIAIGFSLIGFIGFRKRDI